MTLSTFLARVFSWEGRVMYSALGIESGGGKALENDDVDVLWENNVNQYEDYCNIGQRMKLIINVCRI